MAAWMCFAVLGVLVVDSVGQENGARTVTFLVSPNGQLLAYPVPAYDEEGEKVTRIMVCGPAGEGQRELAATPGHCHEVLWLGDDRVLATDYDWPGYLALALNGDRLGDLVIPEGCYVSRKCLSPDAQRVAFVGGYTPPGGEIQAGLFAVDFRIGDVQRLVPGALATAPAWSPDSTRLAVSSAAGYVSNHPLVVADVETGDIIATRVQGVGPAWSPDGTLIACTTGSVRGGTWRGGVPTDGCLGLVEVGPWTMTHISPPGRNEYDKATGRREMEGALGPVWSRDGEWLAYTRCASLRPRKGERDEDSSETWIVRRTGEDANKVLDGGPFALAWGADGEHLYGLHPWQRKLVRVDLATSEVATLASWEQPRLPELPEVKPTVVQRPGAIVRLVRIGEEYGKALAAILSEARRQYDEVLGLGMPDTLELDVTFDPRRDPWLWTDGESRLYLLLSSRRQLAPPTESGVFNIYGICHALGHSAMCGQLENVAGGLPEGVGEGWAHYAGSVVVDEVAKALGDAIWPERYDTAAVEGMARLRTEVDGKTWGELSPSMRAAKVFYDIEVRHGRDALTGALRAALARASIGKDVMPLFVQALRDATGDPKAGGWIPEGCLVPHVKWDAPREVADDFFDALRTEADETGVMLLYDDGTSEGGETAAGSGYARLFRTPGGDWYGGESAAGSGYAVLFGTPEGDWAVDRVSVFGSCYGAAERPGERFWVYVCAEDFEPLAVVARPYAMFGRWPHQWHEIDIDPVRVPNRFYVCVAFKPTAEKGLYVCYDDSVEESHSRSAVPYSHVSRADGKYDWMIRAHIKRAE